MTTPPVQPAAPTPPADSSVRGLIPEQDLILKIDFGGGVQSRSFIVETSLSVPNGRDGDAFLAKLNQLLADQSDDGMLAIYQHVFKFATVVSGSLSKPTTDPRAVKNGNAMLQAACGLIRSDPQFEA